MKFLIIIFVVVALDGIASTPKFTNLEYTTKSLNKSIRDIIQDSDGYMWFATTSGLYKYDGYEISNFPISSTDTDIAILKLYLDVQGVLWACTRKNGLYKLVENSWIKFEINLPEFENNLTVYDIVQHNSEFYWLATDKGLKYISKSQDLTSSINSKFSIFQTKTIHSLEVIDNVEIMLSTKGSISILNTSSHTYESIDIGMSSDIIVHDFQLDDFLHLWMATNQGLYKYDLMKKVFMNNPIQNISSRFVKIVKQKGYLWMASISKGIFRINTKNEEIVNYLYDKTRPSSLMENSILSLFVSKDNVLWVGGFYKGINFINLNSLKFNYENSSKKSIYCASGNVYMSLLVDEKETLFIGSAGDGLIVFEKGKACTKIQLSENTISKSEVIKSIIEVDNKLWLLTNKQIVSFEKTSQKLEHYYIENLSDSQFIAKMPNRDFFLIGKTKGLFKFVPKLKTFERVSSKDIQLKTAAFNDYLFNEGDIYFATSAGILKIEDDTMLINIPNINDSLPSKYVTSIIKVGEWFYLGIQDKGLIKINAKGERFDVFKDQVTIYKILSYDNELWLATDKGLLRVQTETNKIHIFSKEDGTQNELFFRNGASRNGEVLYFSGSNGLVHFNPRDIKLSKLESNIVLTKLSILNNEVKINESTKSGFLMTKPINQLDEIKLGYKDYILDFEFSLLNYADPQRNEYAYRLKGFQENWVYTDARNRQATYTNLKPGDYTFQVKASNKDGVWTKKPKELEIKVYPAPWFSPWAYFTYVTLLVLSIWCYIQYKTTVSRRRAQQLEVIVAERTKEVSLQKKMVESLLEHKNEVFANVTHEFKTPLALIIGPSEQLADNVDLLKHSDELNMIQRNAKRLLLMVGQILKLSQAENNKEVLRESQSVQSTLLMLYESFYPLAKNKNISINIHNKHDVNVYATPECLQIVIGNLLSNAVKYSHEGDRILIKSQLHGNQVSISIEDTASGIKPEDQNKIFKRFRRLETHKTIAGTGIGLSVVKEITEANDGKVEISSEWGVGSIFTVTFPITDIKPEGQITQIMVDQMVENTSNEVFFEQGKIPKPIKNKATVLIIEDNLDMQTHIGNVLKDSYNCLLADRGRLGIALALKEVPDIIVCDVMMPEMDGYQVTRILRHDSRTSHIPIVLLTALNTIESRIKGWRENIDSYIAKPFHAKELNIQLENILTIRKLLQQKTNKAIKSNGSLKDLDLPKQDLKFIEKLKRVIDSIYTNEYIQKADIAAKMAVSERQLHRKVKALIDESPMDMLRDYRLEKAAMKLKDGYNVGIISDKCGFSSVSYFGSCFKKKYGVTPKQYQKLNTQT